MNTLLSFIMEKLDDKIWGNSLLGNGLMATRYRFLAYCWIKTYKCKFGLAHLHHTVEGHCGSLWNPGNTPRNTPETSLLSSRYIQDYHPCPGHFPCLLFHFSLPHPYWKATCHRMAQNPKLHGYKYICMTTSFLLPY